MAHKPKANLDSHQSVDAMVREARSLGRKKSGGPVTRKDLENFVHSNGGSFGPKNPKAPQLPNKERLRKKG